LIGSAAGKSLQPFCNSYRKEWENFGPAENQVVCKLNSSEKMKVEERKIFFFMAG
jgi:hypothetical protein